MKGAAIMTIRRKCFILLAALGAVAVTAGADCNINIDINRDGVCDAFCFGDNNDPDCDFFCFGDDDPSCDFFCFD